MRTLIKSVARKTGLLKLYHAARNFFKKNYNKRYKAKNDSGYYCIGCGKYWTRFKPLQPAFYNEIKKAGWPYRLDEAETLNYSNYSCYGCNMLDRERLYAMYLKDNIEPSDSPSILEFAPSKPLSAFLRSFKNVKYRTTDLCRDDVDDKLDIQDLYKYKDESFDIFICSHVLEHVDDDRKAMRELFRITKKGGWGIAMVPVIEGLETTHEDISIKDEKLRMKYFGQSDHVRLYAKKDFIERLKSAGFTVNLMDVSYFGKEVFEKNGISLKSVLYIVHK